MTDLQEKPLQKLLTRREYTLFLRFGVGPAERFRNDAERAAYRRVCDKIAAEQRRAARAEHDYFLRCAETFERVASEERDAAEKRKLRRLAKDFRKQAAEGMDYVRRRVHRWRARVRRQMKAGASAPLN